MATRPMYIYIVRVPPYTVLAAQVPVEITGGPRWLNKRHMVQLTHYLGQLFFSFAKQTCQQQVLPVASYLDIIQGWLY